MDTDQLIESYTTHLRALNRTPKTVTSYALWIRRFFDFIETIGLHDAADVTAATLHAYQRHEAQQINAKGRVNSIKVQNQHVGIVCGFFKFLHIEGYTAHNPAQHIELAKVPERLPRDILTVREAKRLLKQPDTSTLLGYRDRTIIEVLYSTGIRRQELLDLTLDDIDLETGMLTVRQGKGAKDRVVPLGTIAARHVETYLNGIRDELLSKRVAGPRAETKAVFISARGLPFSRNALAERIEKIAQAAGIQKPVTPHTFRHTCATHMIRNRANVRHVQEMLGHKNLNTTEQYLHLTITDLKEAHHRFHPREKDSR